MNKITTILPPRWLLAGFLAGASIVLATGYPATQPTPKEKMVVVLRGEKNITFDSPGVTLRQFAAEMAKQTGRTFTLDKRFDADKTPYAILLAKTPLSRVLDATAYAAKAKWDKRGLAYHLRPLTAKEMTADPNMIGATMDRLADYLSTVAEDGGNLPDPVKRSIAAFEKDMREQQTTFPPFPEGTMGNWTLHTSDHGLGISYLVSQTQDNTSSSQWQSRSWGWGNERQPLWKIGR